MNKIEISNINKFALKNGVCPVGLARKIKSGYKFGVLDGKMVLYNPKMIIEVNNGLDLIKSKGN